MADNSSDLAITDKDIKQSGSDIPLSNDTTPRADAKLGGCCHDMDQANDTGRNLILCIDGTSNQFGEKNTNVIELYNLILKKDGDRQQTWYNSGIGTYARPSWKSLKYYRQALYHKVDLAIAWDFERTVLAAYRWLSDVYKTGDRIFLFGFSRGAFQVRVLSAMIDKIGLIHKGNELQIPFAYELYADPNSDEKTVTEVGSKQKLSSAERFKKAFSREDVKVHFVGAWDTVSSIGIARGTHMLPHTVDGMQHACFFRQALALDERRVKFLPEYAYGGLTKLPVNPELEVWARPNVDNGAPKGNLNPGTDPLQTATANQETKRPHTLEVWFAGTHSDIGGGNVENRGMDRSRPPLRWMVFEARAAGLRTAQFAHELSTKEQIEIKESLTPVWWLLEILPLRRLTYTRRKNGISETRKPHLGSPRKIHEGQKIHSSLLLAERLINNQLYTPKARPLDENSDFWETARRKGLGEWLEQDLYQYVDNLIKRFIDNLGINQVDNNVILQNLRQIALGADGQHAVCNGLYNGLIDTLENSDNLKKKMQLLEITMDILRKSPFVLKQAHSAKICTLALDLPTDDDPNRRHTIRIFLARCTDSQEMDVLHEHTGSVASVAFSPDGKCIASGSFDRTIRIWDSETGKQIGDPLQGHTNSVNSVAFSPDGKRIVSGSDDRTIWIWDGETGTQIGKKFQGHTHYVMSVAFSPDGKHVVSGSADTTVRIWDVETGTQVGKPLQGYTDWIKSVAFSPDGKRVISGSDDKTIRLWDLETGMQIGEPIRGHTDCVRSVAFSPDGKRIVSGSWDKTVRIWDSETGKQVGVLFQGHTECVWFVAFSPDGKRVVSGSDDQTVRIWDAATGEQAGEPFKGHTDRVRTVAFSPDGKRVVSGSDDMSIRIWDAEIYQAAA